MAERGRPPLFFGPLESVQGTDEHVVHPLPRDQGSSACVRDTGRTHGGRLEWGCCEETGPRSANVQEIGDTATRWRLTAGRELRGAWPLAVRGGG